MSTLTYRLSPFVTLAGLAAAGSGVFFAWPPLNSLYAHQPWTAWTRRLGTHVAGSGEIAVAIGFGIALVLAGLAFFIGFATQSITLDGDGVVVRGFLGRVMFMASYSQMEAAETCSGSRNGYLLLAGNGRSLKLTNMYSGIDDLLKNLKVRAPQIRT